MFLLAAVVDVNKMLILRFLVGSHPTALLILQPPTLRPSTSVKNRGFFYLAKDFRMATQADQGKRCLSLFEVDEQ